MPVPPFQELFLPTLELLSDGEERDKKQVSEHLVTVFQITPDEINEILPSGRQTKLMNRIAWTRTYFAKAGLVEPTSRGRFRITQRGRDLLGTGLERMDVRTLKQYPEFAAFHQSSSGGSDSTSSETGITTPIIDETPEERLATSYESLKKELGEILLQQVIQSSPAFFEKLVVDVLVAMGYGGWKKDAGTVTGKSGDEGIDGVIKEDRLGLDQIYLQAKRWQNPVGRPQVQHFVGSLVGQSAHKGVMLTTSRFTEEAKQFVKHLPQRVVLIDGEELANLMIEFNVGVNPDTSYTVKKLDMDYFEES